MSTLIRAALFALLLVVSCRQNPPAPQPQPATRATSTFALYGDCRDGHRVHAEICANLLKSDAGFVVNTGDLVAEGKDGELWAKYRDIIKPLRDAMPIYSAKGNHDFDKTGGRAFEEEFGLDKPYYEKRIGDVHFFFLDSNSRFGDEQLAWFDAAAAASTAPHRVAVFHHPPVTMVARRVKDAERIHERIHAPLVKHKFCGALLGHDHNFFVTRRDGLCYAVSGGGGAPLYPMDESLARTGDLWRKFHHYAIFTVEPKKLSARVFTHDGHEHPELAFTFCEHP